MARNRLGLAPTLRVLAACATLSLTGFAAGQDATRIDEVLRHLADERGFMGSVLLARGDEVLFSEGYGSANIEWNRPNTSTTKFQIGSLTKQFTAALILMLEERGALRTSDRVRRHLPDLPALWDEITIFHLLAHQSGITEILSLPEAATWQLLPAPIGQTVSRLYDQPLDFPPGTQARYSNSGYLVLGYLIEEVTGQSYAEFLSENVLEPLKMTSTGYHSNAILAERASGYLPNGDRGHVNAPFLDLTFTHAAGALYSTTEDLFSWSRALLNGELLSAESMQKMRTPYLTNHGLGFVIDEINGRAVIGHDGATAGFMASVSFYPESATTVIVLANVRAPVVTDARGYLAALVRGEPVTLPAERQSISLDGDRLELLLGTYTVTAGDQFVPSGVNLIVTSSDDGLFVQTAFGSRVPVFAVSATRLYAPSAQMQLDFAHDGEEMLVTIEAMGQRQVQAHKLPTRSALELAPAALERFAGTYTPRPDAPGFRVFVEAGKLVLQLPPSAAQAYPPMAELHAATPDTFFLREMDWQIEFVTEDSGPATALILVQPDQRIRAQRR